MLATVIKVAQRKYSHTAKQTHTWVDPHFSLTGSLQLHPPIQTPPSELQHMLSMTYNGWSCMWLGFAKNRWIKMLSLYIYTPPVWLILHIMKSNYRRRDTKTNSYTVCVAFRWCIISDVWLEVETGHKKVLKCAGWKSVLAFFASLSFALCLSQCVWVRERVRVRER